MYKYIYLLLKQRLLAKIPELKDVDWYRGQDIKTNKGILKALPGAYIFFYPTDMTSLPNGIQQGIISFYVMLITDTSYDDDRRIDDPITISHLDLMTKIHTTLSGESAWLSDLPAFTALKGTDNDLKVYNSVDRTNIAHNHDIRVPMITKQDFKCLAKDASGNKQWTKTVKELELLDLQFNL